MTKRCLSLCLVLCLLFGLTGCASFGADVEGQLRPPQANGEQGRIEEALGEYIASTLTQENYVLKYPRGGAYRSAFVVEDMDGDGHVEALAFYRLSAENSTTHINLLHQVNGHWESVSDFVSQGADMECVTLGDMNGDGVRELFVCWDMYSARTYQLSMYELNGNRIVESFTGNCAQVTVGDLTGDGLDNCLLFHLGTNEMTATLWGMRGNEMEELGRTVVDVSVQRLRTAHIVPLTEGRNGVFVDCQRSGDWVATELLYWDGARLVAPFYSDAVNGNIDTVRAPDIASGDVDEDGFWEWPTCELLSGFESSSGNSEDTTRWRTTFWSWEPLENTMKEKFSCIYNSRDRYFLALEPAEGEQFTTSYDSKTRTLWVYPLGADGVTSEALLAIRTSLDESGGEQAGDFRQFRPFASGNVLFYSVWYREVDTYALNMEKLQYMLTML